jgi:hypothetical protein
VLQKTLLRTISSLKQNLFERWALVGSHEKRVGTLVSEPSVGHLDVFYLRVGCRLPFKGSGSSPKFKTTSSQLVGHQRFERNVYWWRSNESDNKYRNSC